MYYNIIQLINNNLFNYNSGYKYVNSVKLIYPTLCFYYCAK